MSLEHLLLSWYPLPLSSIVTEERREEDGETETVGKDRETLVTLSRERDLCGCHSGKQVFFSPEAGV